MNSVKCRTTKILLQDYIDGNLTEMDTGFITAHLQECAACREDYRQTLEMIDLLKGIPVAPASTGFAERALSNAVRSNPVTAGSRIKYVTGGIAASLVALTLLISGTIGPDPERPDPAVVIIGEQVKTIRVAIESSRVIEDIEMRIDVSDNLEIEGYDQRQVIRWTTRLEQGTNLIALPVSATAGGDGEIVARLSLGGNEKVFRIRTRYRADGNVSSDYRVLAGRSVLRKEVRL